MARRKEKSKMIITANDKAFFQVLAKTGRCRAEDVEQYFSIKKGRLNKMIHNGYLEKEAVMVNAKPETCYKLTVKARKWISKNVSSVRIHYKPCNRGTNHDLVLFKQLAELPIHLQNAAMPEKEVAKIYGLCQGYSAPDLFIPSITYTDDYGNVIETATQVIEVITSNYSNQAIQAKIDYCREFLGIEKGGINFVNLR